MIQKNDEAHSQIVSQKYAKHKTFIELFTLDQQATTHKFRALELSTSNIS